jgi:hypothetical protein
MVEPPIAMAETVAKKGGKTVTPFATVWHRDLGVILNG